MRDFFASLNKLKFDKRMIKWNLNKKVFTAKEYENHLESLEDISPLQAEPLKEEEEDTKKESENEEGKLE